MHRILHLLDATTPPEAVEMLALIRAGSTAMHEVAALGHRSTGALVSEAGMQAEAITWLPSTGWADPMGWRAVRRLLSRRTPTHVHAWGIPAALAAASFPGPKLITLVEPPAARHRWVMRLVNRRPWQWIVTSNDLAGQLQTLGVAAERMTVIPPAADVEAEGGDRGELRKALGIAPHEGPVLLLAGEGGGGGGSGGAARHDYGLWAAAILQQIYPHIRVVVRDDARGRQDHGLDRLIENLADNRITIDAPREYSWRQLMAMADMLLVTADRAIPTGGIVRAMAAGLPVIATPLACVREVIEDGRNGLLTRQVRPRDIAARIEEFFADPAVGPKLAQAAREDVAAKFAPQAMREAYGSLYQGVEARTGEPMAAA